MSTWMILDPFLCSFSVTSFLINKKLGVITCGMYCNGKIKLMMLTSSTQKNFIPRNQDQSPSHHQQPQQSQWRPLHVQQLSRTPTSLPLLCSSRMLLSAFLGLYSVFQKQMIRSLKRKNRRESERIKDELF